MGNSITINKRLVVALVAVLVVVLAVMTAFRSSVFGPAAVDFKQYPAGPARKQAFVSHFLPLIHGSNEQIMKDRLKLLALRDKDSLGYFEETWLQALAEEYKMPEFQLGNELNWVRLIGRVDVIAPSLALAQSANESAWGTSRFARLGNNFFGQWCFKSGCGIVPKARSAGATHEVRVFDSAEAAVEAYMHNLNTHRAYRELREIRAEVRQENNDPRGVDLAKGLVAYSSRGLEYVSELRHMINHNKWQQYDRVR